jgi:hypothetical protein
MMEAEMATEKPFSLATASRVFAVKKDAYNNPPSPFISHDVYFQWLIVRLAAVLSRSTNK